MSLRQQHLVLNIHLHIYIDFVQSYFFPIKKSLEFLYKPATSSPSPQQLRAQDVFMNKLVGGKWYLETKQRLSERK